MTRPTFGDVRWVTWAELCAEEQRAKARIDPETCLTVRLGQADRLAQSVRPNAENEKWWGSWPEEGWWPGLEFAIVGGAVAMVRESGEVAPLFPFR